MHLSAAAILLPVVFLVECNAYAFVGELHYIETGACKVENTCVYAYETLFVHSVDIEAQNVTITATFEVVCDSTGEYAYQKATKYCISVTESYLEHKGRVGNGATALDYQLSEWFCFVQTSNGKIPIVFHPQNESQRVVNFKKALVSGFQANFAGTEEEEEVDPDSLHISHYRYIVEPQPNIPSGHMLRYFDHNDIDRLADRSLIPVGYSKEEELIYSDGVLSYARGETHLVIPQQPKQNRRTPTHHRGGTQESLLNNEPQQSARFRRNIVWEQTGQRNAQTFYPSVTLNPFSVHSTYTLDLVRCSASEGDVVRGKRDIQAAASDGFTQASLRALNSAESPTNELGTLDVASILEYIHTHPEETKQVRVLKEYLSMEDELDQAPAIAEAVNYFNQIRQSTDPADIAMRLKMYPIFASLTNSAAQQALLFCVRDVANVTELNVILMNIALLLNPTRNFATQLQSLIDGDFERDTSPLLLMYGALASRADPSLQTEMVAYLIHRLQESTGDEKDKITLIIALGNSGSSEIIDCLLGIIGNANIEIKLAVINALRKQTNSARVLAAFLDILSSNDPDPRIVGAMINTLIIGFESSSVTDVEATLTIARALLSSSRALQNSYIDELLSYYLNLLRELDTSTDRRLRRDTDKWMQSGTEYNMIASYEDRQEDGVAYPSHSAYLWSQQIGVKNFNLQVASGMFTGATESGDESKILGRTVGRVNAFGHSTTAVEIEVLRSQSPIGDNVHEVVYLTVGGYVLLNFEAFAENKSAPNSFGGGTDYPVLKFELESFVSIATVTSRMVVYAHLESSFGVDGIVFDQPNSYYTRALLSPYLTVQMEGSSTFDVLGTQGGTSMEGAVGYSFDANGYIFGCIYGRPAIQVSTVIKDLWPRGYINLSSWLKLQKMIPCGFQQCLWEGEKVQDSVPIERWMVNAHSEMVWSRSLFVGSPADRGNCQPRPEPTEKPTQQSQDDSSTMPITQDEDYFGEDYESYYEQPSWPDGSRP